INRRVRADKGIEDIKLYDVSVEEKFDYGKIFDLNTYPLILLFHKNEILLKPTTPHQIVHYFHAK
ncbi:hypothetical protein, partial [Paenibacillus xylanexedens]|uniref:hypothetical protein n=1 Tax=Paenibacillus xylanexedens TaxID=528191 RepID=UPI001C92DB45